MFPLNPISNGTGRVLVLVVSAAAILLEVVDAVADEVEVRSVVVAVDAALELAPRRLRSSSMALGKGSEFHSPAPMGGGLLSTRMVPERARRAKVDSRDSASRVSTIRSSMKKWEAEEKETQHVKNINNIKSCVCGAEACL
jgi:hypothetical protein